MIEQAEPRDYSPSDGHGGPQWDGTVKIECGASGRVVFGTLVEAVKVRDPNEDHDEVVMCVSCEGCGKKHRFIMPLTEHEEGEES